MSSASGRKRGLPTQIAMRHDRHFVEELASHTAPTIGRLVPLASIQPHPNQPRSVVGDLSELVASIREKGVLEPILIRPNPSRGKGAAAFEIISGERRYRASLEAGLYEIPAIEMDVSDEEALEIALVENLQREDLSPFEEADGYRALAERHSYTHEQIAQAVGKSRSAITESLTLLKMPPKVRDSVRALGVSNKSLLLELLKLDHEKDMLQLLERDQRPRPGARSRPQRGQASAPRGRRPRSRQAVHLQLQRPREEISPVPEFPPVVGRARGPHQSPRGSPEAHPSRAARGRPGTIA